MVRDGTYDMIKSWSNENDRSLSDTVQQAMLFMLETYKCQGMNLPDSPEFKKIYNDILCNNKQTAYKQIKQMLNRIGDELRIECDNSSNTDV